MDISLPENLKKYIHTQMANGHYHDASALISDALQQKILREQHADNATEALRHEIMLGWDEADRGEFATFDLAAMKKDLDTEYHG